MTTLAIPDLLGTCPADLVQLDQLAQSTPDEARARADRIRAGLADYTRMRQDIADARARRDWISLGHDTWHAYVEAEFGEALRALTRDEQHEAIRDFRADGMSMPQIASAVGVGVGTVHRALAAGFPDGKPAPDKVTGSDGKQYPATRPPSTTDTPAGSDATSPAPDSADKVTPVGADRGGEVKRDAGLAAAPRPETDPAAAVAAAIEAHLPPDPSDEFRAWRRGFMSDVGAAYRAISRNSAEQVAEMADDECMAELERVAAELIRFAEQVRRLRAQSLPDNVVPIGRP